MTRTTLRINFALCLLLATAVHAQDTWTQPSPAPHPSGRIQQVMASIGDDQVLLFGGYDGDYKNDTWVYDLSDNTWTLKDPASKPSQRVQAAMAYIGDHKVLLFGGYDGSFANDTWVYDLSAGAEGTWTQQNPPNSPTGRTYHAMAFIGGDQVLLFGGGNNSQLQLTDETWLYDLSDNNWTQKHPLTSSPSPRYAHAMAPIGAHQVLLFGGSDGAALDGDTWVYDLSDNTWTEKHPLMPPPPRLSHGMASIGADQVLLFGGGVLGGSTLNDTSVYDLSVGAEGTWTAQSPTMSPAARQRVVLASIGGHQALLFGGQSGPDTFDDTWLYTAAPPHCELEHPGNPSTSKTGILDTRLVQAFISSDQCTLCGEMSKPHNTQTVGGWPALQPSLTPNAGSLANRWFWGKLPKQPSWGRIKLTRISPAAPCPTDVRVQLWLRKITDATGVLIPTATGSLNIVLRAAVNDPLNGDMTMIDLPVSFPISLVAGDVTFSSSSLGQALLNLGQPCLPPCTNLEVVKIEVLDANGDLFARPGIWLPN